MFSIRTSGQLSPVIQKLRRDKGWSQTDLGNQVGLSQERISVIEKSPETVSFDQLLTILMALDAEFVVQEKPRLTPPNPELIVRSPSTGHSKPRKPQW